MELMTSIINAYDFVDPSVLDGIVTKQAVKDIISQTVSGSFSTFDLAITAWALTPSELGHLQDTIKTIDDFDLAVDDYFAVEFGGDNTTARLAMTSGVQVSHVCGA